jgi:hypothetical protein
METPVIREEVQAYLQACIAFAEFSRYNELTTAEREAIGNLSQALGLNLHRTPSPGDLLLTATLSNIPPIG